MLTLLNWPGKWLDGGGGWGHRSRGTKMLYVAEEAGKPKIIAETFTQLMW